MGQTGNLAQKITFIVQNYFSILFHDFLDRTIWKKSRHYQFDWVPGIEECEKYWHLNA